MLPYIFTSFNISYFLTNYNLKLQNKNQIPNSLPQSQDSQHNPYSLNLNGNQSTTKLTSMESYGNKQQSLRQTIHTKQILSYTQLAFSNLNCSTIKNHTIKTQLPSHNSFTVPYISVSFPYFPYPNPSTIIKISEKPHTFHLFHLKIKRC